MSDSSERQNFDEVAIGVAEPPPARMIEYMSGRDDYGILGPPGPRGIPVEDDDAPDDDDGPSSNKMMLHDSSGRIGHDLVRPPRGVGERDDDDVGSIHSSDLDLGSSFDLDLEEETDKKKKKKEAKEVDGPSDDVCKERDQKSEEAPAETRTLEPEPVREPLMKMAHYTSGRLAHLALKKPPSK